MLTTLHILINFFKLPHQTKNIGHWSSMCIYVQWAVYLIYEDSTYTRNVNLLHAAQENYETYKNMPT
jgi:hypothetical protein